eukprot:2301887-Amphidinium_carterae.1
MRCSVGKVASLTQVTMLDVSRNKFTGMLQEQGLRNISVEQVAVQGNMLTGHIPASLFQRNIVHVNVGVNKFTGTLPTEGLRQLRAVMQIRVASNLLVGTIPTEGMRALRTVEI